MFSFPVTQMLPIHIVVFAIAKAHVIFPFFIIISNRNTMGMHYNEPLNLYTLVSEHRVCITICCPTNQNT
ncbi:hypothetical protein X975_14922, partial [Stegodyphus mimosarum]